MVSTDYCYYLKKQFKNRYLYSLKNHYERLNGQSDLGLLS